jgi:hypothetical protein
MSDTWYDCIDYKGNFKLSYTSSGGTIYYPAYIQSIQAVNNLGTKEELRVRDILGDLNNPNRDWDIFWIEGGGNITLTGKIMANTLDNTKLNFRGLCLAVTGMPITSFTITSTDTDLRSLTFNDCMCISSSLKAELIEGQPVHSGSITYNFVSIT